MNHLAGTFSLLLVAAAHAQGTGISCSCDFNLDGTVNGQDLSSLLGNWGTNNPPYDINGDGLVEGGDLATLLSQWAQDCNPFNPGIGIVYGPVFATVTSTGLPDHPTGPFDGSEGCFNPNTPSPQNDTWLLPLTPTPTDDPAVDVLAQPGPIGVLVTGAAFYKALLSDGGKGTFYSHGSK